MICKSWRLGRVSSQEYGILTCSRDSRQAAGSVGLDSVEQRPARGVIPTHALGILRERGSVCLLYLHLSTCTLSVSAQTMDNYTTEATELIETYGLFALSLVASKLNIPLDFLMKYVVIGPSLSSA